MSRLIRLVIFLATAIVLVAPVPAWAFGIDVDIDVGNPMDLLDNTKSQPPKPAPVKPAPAVKSTARLPPKAEKRFLQNEVLVKTRTDLAPAALAAIGTRNHLELIETADVALLVAAVHRFRIADGRSVRAVLIALGREPNVLLAQPNYTYALLDAAPPPNPAMPQYTIDQLHLSEAHALATGKAIKVGILDTAIASANAELSGSVAASYEAVAAGAGEDLSHGTALAGIIAAHGSIIGVAPAALLLAVRAFTASKRAGAQQQLVRPSQRP